MFQGVTIFFVLFTGGNMIARLTFFGTEKLFSLDKEREEEEMENIFPLAYHQARALRRKILKICTFKITNPMVVGKFIFKKDSTIEYVCSIFEKEDFRRRIAFKKSHPFLFFFLKFIFEEPQFAVVSLAWKNNKDQNPLLHIQSVFFKQEDLCQIKKELVESLRICK